MHRHPIQQTSHVQHETPIQVLGKQKAKKGSSGHTGTTVYLDVAYRMTSVS